MGNDDYAPSEKEQYAIDCFKFSHCCHFINALHQSKLDDNVIKKIKEDLFEITTEAVGQGIITKVICKACNQEFNVTDYSLW